MAARDSKRNPNPLRLVEPQPNRDAAELLLNMAKKAMRGELVGVVVIPMYTKASGRASWDVLAADRAQTDATYTAGVVAAALAVLQEKARDEAGL